MYKILLATDGSEHSTKTVEKAIDFMGSIGAEITVISVAENISVSNFYKIGMSFDEMESDGVEKLKESLENVDKSLEDSTKKILENTERIFLEKNVTVKTLLKKGHPADVICTVAEEGGFDLVILGSRGLGGIKELFLGSVSNKVAHCVKTSLLIVK